MLLDGHDEGRAAVEEVEVQGAAAGAARGRPHVGAEGRDGGEEQDEARGREGVARVRVAEGEDGGAGGEEGLGEGGVGCFGAMSVHERLRGAPVG